MVTGVILYIFVCSVQSHHIVSASVIYLVAYLCYDLDGSVGRLLFIS